MAGRVFLRGMEGEKYDLKGQRQDRLAAPRVVRPEQRSWRDEKAVGHEDASRQSRAKWMLGPGDDPFLTQTVQVHFVEIDPGGANGGHGHQNEAAFYILSGRGYEVHDGRRYEWSAGDLVVVHNDSRHQHFNASPDQPALALVMKAKALWMFLGLTQQGRRGSIPDGREGDFDERLDWTRLWTPGVERMRKIVHPDDEPWTDTPDGRVRWLARQGMDTRIFSRNMPREEGNSVGRVSRMYRLDISEPPRGGRVMLPSLPWFQWRSRRLWNEAPRTAAGRRDGACRAGRSRHACAETGLGANG